MSPVAFSSDGAKIRVLDQATGRAIARTFDVVSGLERVAKDVPDCRALVNGRDVVISVDKTGQLWAEDAECGGARVAVNVPRVPLRAGLIPDSSLSRFCEWHESEWSVLDAASGRRQTVVAQFPAGAVAPSQDGDLVALRIDDQLGLWETRAGRWRWRVTTGLEVLNALAISPDTTRIVSGGSDHLLRVWDARTGEQTDWEEARGHSDAIYAVAYSPDGRTIVSGGTDRTVRLWDADTGILLRTLLGHEDFVFGLLFSPDGTRLASFERDGAVRLWDVAGIGDPRELRGHELMIYPIAISPDGQRIATGGWDGTVRFWDAASGDSIAAVRTLTLGEGGVIVRDLAYSPDGAWIAATSETWRTAAEHVQRWIVLLNAATGEVVSRHTGFGGVVTIAFHPSGQRLAAATTGLVRVWSMPGFEQVGQVDYDSAGGNALGYSPDGRVLAIVSPDFSVRLVDSESLNVLHRLVGHTDRVKHVAFSPDGRLVATASDDQTVRLWQASTGEPIATMRGHSERVHCVEFSPDGTRLASSSNDQTIRLWDPETFEEVAQLRGHREHVWSIAWSPDGAWLASGSGDYTARIWETQPLRVRLAARRERLALLPEAELLVNELFAEYADASEVVRRIGGNPAPDDRLREIALQTVLAESIRHAAPSAD